MTFLARQIAALIDAATEPERGDGQDEYVGYGRIEAVDTGLKLAYLRTYDGVGQWLPYPSRGPRVGEEWRYRAPERGPARLEDLVPERAPGGEEVANAMLGVVILSQGAQAPGQTLLLGEVRDQDDLPITGTLAILDIRASDGAADAEPSATAALTPAADGDVLAGGGTAQVHLRTGAAGTFQLYVGDAPSTRYIWVRQGPGSPVWIRHQGAPRAILIT